jgi:hypothetical protein
MTFGQYEALLLKKIKGTLMPVERAQISAFEKAQPSKCRRAVSKCGVLHRPLGSRCGGVCEPENQIKNLN